MRVASGEREITAQLKFYVAGRLEYDGHTRLARLIRNCDAIVEDGGVVFSFWTAGEYRYADHRRVLLADALCGVAGQLIPMRLE